MKANAMARTLTIALITCLIIGAPFSVLVSTAKSATFSVGDTVESVSNLNIRAGPGTNYPETTDPDYPDHAPEGAVGEILDGPSSANGYIWWEVDFGPGLYSGWSVEDGLREVTLVAPDPPSLVSPSDGATDLSLTPTFEWANVSDAEYYGFYINKLLYGADHLVFDSQVDYGPRYEADVDLDSFFVNSELSFNTSSKVLPPTEDESICIQSLENMCLSVYTGTARSLYRISNPNGVSGFQEYHLVNFDQRLVGETSNSIDVEVISEYYVDTNTPYPVDHKSLPGNIQNNYLQPQPGWIQSDDPEIVAQANDLVVETTKQAEAVDAILTWARAHIEYDYDAPANDASSVFRNRSAVCAGFSTLSIALLRAAGIPSRYQRGCATPFGYRTGEGGGWHAWVETYYPDVGWVASEPQVSANVIGPGVIFQGFDQCGHSDTVITRTSYVNDTSGTYALRTPYDNSIRYSFQTASIPSWDRHPLRVAPLSPTAMLPVTNPVGDFSLQVENLSCNGEDWQVRAEVPWLSPNVITGTTAGNALFSIDASGMPTGSYSAPMTLYTTSSHSDWDLSRVMSRTITANLLLVDRVYQTYLPIVAKDQ